MSDLHAHNHTAFASTLGNGRNSRLQDILDVIEYAGKVAEEYAVDGFCFLGDVFHNRTRVDTDVYSATFLAFQQLCKKVPWKAFIVGNHDQHTKVGDIHALEPFKSFAYVVDGCEVLHWGDVKIAACAFNSDPTVVKAFGQECGKVDLFLFHQGLKEATVGAFDVYVRAELSVSDLPTQTATYCLGGHYHKHQWVKDNVAYIGSPLQLDFGERTEVKGFLLVDTDSKEPPKFIPTEAPIFAQLESAGKFTEALEKGLVDPDKDFIRVTCSEKHGRMIKEGWPRVQIDYVFEEQKALARIDPASVGNDSVLIQSYIDQQKPNGLDLQKLYAYGVQLLLEGDE